MWLVAGQLQKGVEVILPVRRRNPGFRTEVDEDRRRMLRREHSLEADPPPEKYQLVPAGEDGLGDEKDSHQGPEKSRQRFAHRFFSLILHRSTPLPGGCQTAFR